MSELPESKLFSSKGFTLISSTEIPDCSSTGIYLRHDRTGLEVFHLLNDDAENLFAFAFRTPVKDSTGAPHILEHSVFCGSQKFPLKEPFTNLMNQSVNTFLNAMTYSDKTVYPASSMIRSDYFNLMDVYGDAVFFPLLKKEAFLQEARRLEIDGKGRCSIQGVVYNEMKGNYSSFESVAADVQLRSLFPDTAYAFDSGGDPLVIPEFSYEAFRAFHEAHYRPDNCLVFLYGNIPTAEQLDFLQSSLLSRLEERFPAPPSRASYPFVPEEFVSMETAAAQEEPVEVRADAPDSGATGSTVTLNWLCGGTSDIDSAMECAFLAEVLVGHDGSPLAKALIESGLGDDLAPITGTSGDARQFLFSLGLHGVKARDADKVRALILGALSDLCARPVDRRDIASALMASEFANREVFRSGGPYSLVLLERALNGWNYGRQPADMLCCRAAFEKIRAKVEENPSYVQDLIRRYLLENRRRSFVVVSPSKSYLARRARQEKAVVARLERASSREDVRKEMELLHAYQQRRETAAEASCIPGLALSDLPAEADCIRTELCERGAGQARTVVFKNVEKTNGIAYVEFCVPVDALPAEAYPYLPLYAYCAANSGWNGRKWDECAAEAAVHTGGIGARLFSLTAAEGAEAERMAGAIAPYHCRNRDWISFSTRILSEHLEDGMAVFAEAFSTFEFTDVERLKKLTAEMQGAVKSSVIPRGSKYAALRAKRFGSHSCMVNEIWHGITQLFAIDRIAAEEPSALSARFSQITEALRNAGAVVHATADGETMRRLEPFIDAAVSRADLRVPKPRSAAPGQDLSALAILPGEAGQEAHEAFSAATQVGFAAAALPCARFGSPECAAELVYAHWLSGAALWEKIRTTGGAYGASASCASIPGLFVFSSYRDPTPEQSLSVLDDVLGESAAALLEPEECARLVAGAYGEEVQPNSPSGRGSVGFMRTLCCISDAERSALLRGLLAVTPEAVRAAAERISAAARGRRSAVISGGSSKSSGFIVKLPL